MDSYKKFGVKTKKAYSNWTSDPKTKYKRLKVCLEMGHHPWPMSRNGPEGEKSADDEWD